MFYRTQKMNLECIRIVKRSPVNDILICQDHNTAAGNRYILLVINEHQTAKKYLEIFETAGLSAQDSYIDSFSEGGSFYMVFEYKKERPLEQFYTGNVYTLAECEDICINLILACISSNLPYPILYLILKQRQIHLSKDHGIYFGYQIDLTELDERKGERDCVVQCAMILKELLSPKASQKAFSYRILEKKVSRRSYDRFTELYKDIRITAVPEKKNGFRKRIETWLKYHQEGLFRILLWICLVVVFLAVISLLSQLIFGDIPWLRVLINGFKVIGTESLLQ